MVWCRSSVVVVGVDDCNVVAVLMWRKQGVPLQSTHAHYKVSHTDTHTTHAHTLCATLRTRGRAHPCHATHARHAQTVSTSPTHCKAIEKLSCVHESGGPCVGPRGNHPNACTAQHDKRVDAHGQLHPAPLSNPNRNSEQKV